MPDSRLFRICLTMLAISATGCGTAFHRADPETLLPKMVIHGISFVSVPGGTFLMGDETGNLHAGCGPVHTVIVPSFEMSVCEITNVQYAEYLNDALATSAVAVADGRVTGISGPYREREYLSLSVTRGPDNHSQIQFRNGKFTVSQGKERLPVVSVTWYGARAFALHYGFDLPTETEWEYAARGGMGFPYGTKDGSISTDRANYWAGGRRGPIAVGSYPANPFGLHDMAGNVWEWCLDRSRPYPGRQATDPVDASDGIQRIVRGGGWEGGAVYCRTALRGPFPPESRLTFIGFRVVPHPSEIEK